MKLRMFVEAVDRLSRDRKTYYARWYMQSGGCPDEEGTPRMTYLTKYGHVRKLVEDAMTDPNEVNVLTQTDRANDDWHLHMLHAYQQKRLHVYQQGVKKAPIDYTFSVRYRDFPDDIPMPSYTEALLGTGTAPCTGCPDIFAPFGPTLDLIMLYEDHGHDIFHDMGIRSWADWSGVQVIYDNYSPDDLIKAACDEDEPRWFEVAKKIYLRTPGLRDVFEHRFRVACGKYVGRSDVLNAALLDFCKDEKREEVVL